MSKWKLARQTFGKEEFILTEGEEVTVGRGLNNTITLTSINISRNHCVLRVRKDDIVITDLKSVNGVYVGLKKIPPEIPYVLDELDIIGIGWTVGVPLVDINDTEKYVFKLFRFNNMPSIINRLQFQTENDFDEIERNIAALDNIPAPRDDTSPISKNKTSPVLGKQLSLKRKQDVIEIKQEKKSKPNEEIVNLLSDSETEDNKQIENKDPKVKLESIAEESPKISYKDQIKMEDDDLFEYEAFNVKQEYMNYEDNEPINLDSDSDIESEQWYIRLSQNSPGKAFSKIPIEVEEQNEDSSYSQMEGYFPNISFNEPDNTEDEDVDDLIQIPEHPPDNDDYRSEAKSPELELFPITNDVGQDVVDGSSSKTTVTVEKALEPVPVESVGKKAQLIEPLVQHKYRSRVKPSDSDISGRKKSSKHSKVTKQSSHKRISNSQKEERKKKLKEIATKEKESDISKDTSIAAVKPTAKVKMTTTNRGAFLTNAVQVVKSTRRKKDAKDKHEKASTQPVDKESTPKDNIENKKCIQHRPCETKEIEDNSAISNQESRVPLKSLKPIAESTKVSGKPISLMEPLPSKTTKKKVRFSENKPEVYEFEIEPGNKMKRTSLAKTSLVDIRQIPVFSLEKITLMKILRWNPHWLDEQINNNEPPPILGHNNPPMTVFHSFVNHHSYVQLVGDLLLMEIWECLSVAHMKLKNQSGGNGIQMRIRSLPPIPSQERSYELFNLSVDVSMLSHETKNMPRVGEIMVATFGPDNMNSRFFYVHNIRTLPSPPNNKYSFYSISLQATYTEKMKSLHLGEEIVGRSLAYISKELNLFEAMEYLAKSPLCERILKPDSSHFPTHTAVGAETQKPWNRTLNRSQQLAVSLSVNAALGDKPRIEMVKGPPGTGKSSVICAIVMSYFYDENSRRQQNRGKILICATSNAAVDELVIRLLNIRQSLPKNERFRMVRVGRAEAMHARARDVSSQQLAARDAGERRDAPPAARAGLLQEITHLEAKINMWKTLAQDATDPARVAFLQGRVAEVNKKIALLRSGGGGSNEDLRPDQLIGAEKRIIEGADIVVTTLSSALNHKMRGLKRRIALCIVDEAGQAIEPETLIPLTLDVTRMTLIGDPQQLPGYICSQRARLHGLGASLFSRLCGGAVLLDEQYRMHPHVADYPNRAFYDGRVATRAPPRPALPAPPYAILALASGDRGQGISGANEIEACGVSRLVVALASALRSRSLSLAVITPYNAHKELIKKYLKILQNSEDAGVEVNTVDSFQGQERDVVVVSLARSRGLGFLTDAGRMNVMLTRAKHCLLICLNPQALLKNDQWRTLVEDAQRRNMYKNYPNKFCQPISSGAVNSDEILEFLNKT